MYSQFISEVVSYIMCSYVELVPSAVKIHYDTVNVSACVRTMYITVKSVQKYSSISQD